MLPQTAYYGIIATVLLLILLGGRGTKFSGITAWLLLAALLSISLNDVPSLFKSEQRLTAFFIVVLCVGPFFFNAFSNTVRNYIFSFLNNLILLFTVFSFIFYILKLPISKFYADLWQGLFNHSLMMGALAGISVLLSTYLLFESKNRRPFLFREKSIVLISIAISFFSLVLSASRVAIVATLLGFLFFFYRLYKNQLTKIVKYIMLSLAIIFGTFPVWSTYTQTLQKKVLTSEEKGDLVSSRRLYWNARIEEFISSPIVGIGFASVDVNSGRNDFNKETGVVEPGSSWLSILSMIGIVGFLPVLIIFVSAFKILRAQPEHFLINTLHLSILVFFIVHMIAEGYFLASGSFLFFYVWLLLGVIMGTKKRLKLGAF